MTTRKSAADAKRRSIIEAYGRPAEEVAAELGVALSSVETAWRKARKAGLLARLPREPRRASDGRPPLSADVIADILAGSGRESYGAGAKRLGLTLNQVAGYRARSAVALARPEVRAAYDRLVAAREPTDDPPAAPAEPAVLRSKPKRRKAPTLAPVGVDPADAPAPVAPQASPPEPRRVEAPARTQVEPAPDAPERRAAPPLAIAPDRDAPPAGLGATARAVWGLRADTCRWPLGVPGDADFAFCGAPKPIERPYCAACAARAFAGSVPRFVARSVPGATPRSAA